MGPSPRVLLLTGLWLLVAALSLLIFMVRDAQAGQFSPPTQHQAQRIIGNAYDGRLRSRYPRAGIRTRCRGRRHLLCSVHVWRRGDHLAWFMTRVDLENGRVVTALSSSLDGVIRIPAKTLMYRSRPWSPR